MKVKSGYYLELSTFETMKLLRSTENKITKDKNSQNAPHLVTSFNLVNNSCQQNSRIL